MLQKYTYSTFGRLKNTLIPLCTAKGGIVSVASKGVYFVAVLECDRLYLDTDCADNADK